MTDGFSSEGDVAVACNYASDLFKESGGSLIFQGIGFGYSNDPHDFLDLKRIVRSGNGGVVVADLEGRKQVPLCAHTDDADTLLVHFTGLSDTFDQLQADCKCKKEIVEAELKKLQEFAAEQSDLLQAEFKQVEKSMGEDHARLRRNLEDAKKNSNVLVEFQKGIVKKAKDTVDKLTDKLADADRQKKIAEEECEQLQSGVSRAVEAENNLDYSAVGKAKEIAESAMDTAFKTQAENLGSHIDMLKELKEDLGTDDPHHVHELGKSLRAMTNHKHLVPQTIHVKKKHLDNALWYLNDTLQKFRNPETNPLMMTIEDKVKLVEQALDDEWKLDLVNGRMTDNFTKVLNHTFPKFQRGSHHSGPDGIFHDAVESVRRANLDISCFMEKRSQEDLSTQEFQDWKRLQAKGAKEGRPLSLEEFMKTPPTIRIWKTSVQPQCVSIAGDKFADLQPVLARRETLEEEVGKDREEMKEKKDDFMAELKEEQEERLEDLKELQEELKSLVDKEDKKTMSDTIATLKRSIADEKKSKMKDWSRKVDELGGITKCLKFGVNGNRELTAEKYDFYVRELESAAMRVLDQLRGTVNAPYTTFSQKFAKYTIRFCLELGQRNFYHEAQKFDYLAGDYDAVCKKTIEERLRYIETPRELRLADNCVVDRQRVVL